jgi:prepilin-type N-terminal cleavage/methylation domain-containing protein
MSCKPHNRRTGFTLAEMLIVIAIIGILMAMTAGAVFNVIRDAKEAAVRIELTGLANAMREYKIKYGSYPPLLSDTDAVSRHLRSRFPERSSDDADLPDEGNPAESLVFWLSGFGANPEYPVRDRDKGSPLFEFDQQRLCIIENEGKDLTCGPDVEDDALTMYFPKGLKKPYVYFDGFHTDGDGASSYTGSTYDGLSPYKMEGNKWVKDGSFQIISAGLDDQYGPAGVFPDGPYDPGGDDNMTNFVDKTLGDERESR